MPRRSRAAVSCAYDSTWDPRSFDRRAVLRFGDLCPAVQDAFAITGHASRALTRTLPLALALAHGHRPPGRPIRCPRGPARAVELGTIVAVDSSRHDAVNALTVVNEVPLTLGALATYGVGRLAGWPVVADVGAHLSETLVTTVALDETLRIATASALSEEMRVRDAPGRVYIEPALFAAALIPGFTRIYLDQHWSSDIVAGSALGAFIGARVVRYAHGHATRLDRFLLGARVVPRADGVSVGWSLVR